MKLMIIKTIRISKCLDDEIKRVSYASGLAQQDVIRLAVQKGLKLVEEFASAVCEEKEAGDEQK